MRASELGSTLEVNRVRARRGAAFALLGCTLAVACGGDGSGGTGSGGAGGSSAGALAQGGGAGSSTPAAGHGGGGSAGTGTGAVGGSAGTGTGAVGGSAGTGTGGSAGTGAAGAAATGAGGGRGGEDAAGGSAGTGAAGTSNGGAGGTSLGGQSGGGAGGSSAGSGGKPASCPNSTLMKGDSNRMLKVGSTERTYILHVPANYTGMTPVPLVLDFHGLGGSGSQQKSSSGYQQQSDKAGFLVAFPDGIDNAWNIGPCCTNSRDVDDLGFAKAMVAAIEADGCVDPTRVYATGFSMGGGMSQYLMCNAADVFAAATPASFDLLVPDEEPCAPSRPGSVLAFRGTADTVVPYAGGKGSSGKVTFLGAQASFQRWQMIDGCDDTVTTDGDCTYHTKCDAGVEVGLCVKQGGSHAPGDAGIGWAFLSKFTLP